ncbi:hypothetical protein [Rhodococcus spongiicola]|uniref:Uncharacterized protein n=1 Tax=Rhodococcus spongiicola TaxID=2487352 RepID=A0A3S3AFQ0_9NOCA|nr:hypothetical protein [Rhodococcus spongiicola]RVW03594.1 hypothetical protein EF834_10885 [Rhodococcus spongiicola]
MRTPLLSHPFSRRAALRVAGSATLGASAVALTTGCSNSGRSELLAEIAELATQAERARRDAATANAAIARFPDRAGALGTVAAEREAHADALDAEIARIDTGTPPTSPETPPVTSPPTLEQLRSDLADSQKEAARLARTQSGYRAGLLGSISAACAAQQAVLL